MAAFGSYMQIVFCGGDMDWEKTTKLAYEIGKSKRSEERLNLFRKAVEYSRMRVDWQLSAPEEQVHMGEKRRTIHNEFIEACDSMSKNMQQEGEDASWRADLGDDRKEIGDFACYVNLILGLVAR